MSTPQDQTPTLVPLQESAQPASAQTAAQKPHVWLRFHWVLAASVALLVFVFYSFQQFSDPDIWWHLNNAEQFVTTGHLPTVDIYSYTAKGATWINHEWLSELPYYFALKFLGIRGLYALTLLLSVVVTLAIFYRSYRYTGDVKNAFVIAVVSVLLTVVSYGPRTLIFGWLFLVIELYALDRFREGSTKWLFVLPPLFCLWINSHGSWLIGLVVFGIVAASGLVEFSIGLVESHRWSKRQITLLLTALGLIVIALFLNPYGYHLVKYPYDMAFHQKLNIQHVEEWASVDFHTPRGKLVFGLIGWILATVLFSKKKWRLDEVLLLLLGVYSGITYVRFLFLLAILISPMLVARLDLFPPYDEKADKPVLNLIVILFVVAWIAIRFPSVDRLKESSEKVFPVQSLAYLREHNIRDRVFNSYFWGGYLERNYREMPVFIDSRADIFEYNGSLKDYLDIISLKNTLGLLDKHQIQYVYFPPDDPLPYMLKNTGNWETLYEDKVSVLLKRRTPLATK